MSDQQDEGGFGAADERAGEESIESDETLSPDERGDEEANG